MNIEKYTERARGFIQSAQTLALGKGHQQFAPLHLLKVLLDDDQGMANGLITRAGGDPKAAREAFAEVFGKAYQKAGLEVVTAPGPDVLRVRPGVINLYIAAPDTMTSGRSRVYTMESGEATLFLEVRDSTTGALLGRALDRRATRNTGRVQVSNAVTNLSDFEALFRQWAEISIKGFQELRESSPVPVDLKPGQKLGN